MLSFVCLLLFCLANLQCSSCEEDRRNAIISALEKAVTFLGEKHDKINVDAVLGYTVLEAHLKMVLERWLWQPELTLEWQRIQLLKQKLLTFIEEATQDVEKQDPVSHKAFAPALKPGFWKVPREWRKINESTPYSLTSGPCLDYQKSDFCFSAVLGTQEDADVCWIPDNCTSLMINTHCYGYSLSHQLFYFLFAKMQSCPNSLFQNTQYYENVFCDLMMQANRNLEKNNLIDNFADIFTENIMFCGLAGFSDFFQTSWLDRILSWQKQENGCFWMYTSSNDGGQVRRRTKRSERLIGGAEIMTRPEFRGELVPHRRCPHRKGSPPGHHQPTLLSRWHPEEALSVGANWSMGGVCSSHNTGVAVGALGSFLLHSSR